MDAANLDAFAIDYTSAWCSQNAALVAAYFGPDAFFQINQDPPAVGTAAITAVAQSFMTDFPDMVVTLDSLRADGPRVFYHWTMTGTNTGPGGAGKAVNFRGYEVWAFGADGLIAHCTGHFDEAEYVRQLKEGVSNAL